MHLRDQVPTDSYQVEAILYYPSIDDNGLSEDFGPSARNGRQIVDQIEKDLDATQEGEQ
jgi:hypothetical protein